MSLGPITIFDKSTLQSFNPDEAVWFNNFYRANITPLFFVETLANLEKEMKDGRTPEQVVSNLAHKTPILGAMPNVHHQTLCMGDLLGHRVEMRRVPVISGGRPISDGAKKGVHFDQPPEFDALQRWEDGDFLGVERLFARNWRQALADLDLRQNLRSLGLGSIKIRSLTEVREATKVIFNSDGRRYVTLKAALEILGVPDDIRPAIIARWKAEGGPTLKSFAPYAAYVVSVDVVFYLALAAGLISPDRVSNRIDFAYLYYLPFCMVFVSNDNLHARMAPLFLNEDQAFVRGQELKTDLSKLDQHYSALPLEIRERGIMSFAPEPPREGDFLTALIWDQFLPGWRARTDRADRVRNQVGDKAILDALKPMMEAAKRAAPAEAFDIKSADSTIFSRKVPAKRGKWRIVPPEVENERNQ